MKRALAVFLVVCLWAVGSAAQLIGGDVAIVAYNSDSPDAFAWVALTDIPSNTVMSFTDSSVSNANFRWSEHLSAVQGGPLSWSHSNDVSRGTVVLLDESTTNWSIGNSSNDPPALSASGDQVFVYTGSIAYNGGLSGNYKGDPSGAIMVYGLNFGNEGWSDADSTTRSSIPTGLSSASDTAAHVNDRDNGYYSGITTGSVNQLLDAIADPANWTTSDKYIDTSNWPSEFDILPETLLFEFSWKRAGETPERRPDAG